MQQRKDLQSFSGQKQLRNGLGGDDGYGYFERNDAFDSWQWESLRSGDERGEDYDDDGHEDDADEKVFRRIRRLGQKQRIP